MMINVEINDNNLCDSASEPRAAVHTAASQQEGRDPVPVLLHVCVGSFTLNTSHRKVNTAQESQLCSAVCLCVSGLGSPGDRSPVDPAFTQDQLGEALFRESAAEDKWMNILLGHFTKI